MKDYVPYIKKAMEKSADYKDIVDDVVQQVGNEDERPDIEDSVISYKHISDDSAKSMWATDAVPDIKADIEEAFIKDAFVDNSNSIIDQNQVFELAKEFIQFSGRNRIAPNIKEVTIGDIEKFLIPKRLLMLTRPVYNMVKELQDKIKPAPKEIITRKKASSLLNELASELSDSGDVESAEALKKLL